MKQQQQQLMIHWFYNTSCFVASCELASAGLSNERWGVPTKVGVETSVPLLLLNCRHSLGRQICFESSIVIVGHRSSLQLLNGRGGRRRKLRWSYIVRPSALPLVRINYTTVHVVYLFMTVSFLTQFHYVRYSHNTVLQYSRLATSTIIP